MMELNNLIRDLLNHIDDDATREGLVDTPSRILRSWEEIYSGYGKKVEDVVTIFENKDGYNSIIWAKDINFYSMCEHHMLPFYGKAHVGYIPGKKYLGASKLSRIVDLFARRLQIQERLVTQITTALMESLKPEGAICIIEGVHLCMRMRGVNQHSAVFGTSSAKGVFLEPELEQKFIALIK